MLDDKSLPAFYNGDFMTLSQVSISPMDRGFLFGDSVYEVIPAFHGQMLGDFEHFQRLMQSLTKIDLNLPYSIDDLMSICQPLLSDKNACELIYIQVTRGVEAIRKHRFPVMAEPTVLIYSQPYDVPFALDYQGSHAYFQEDLRWQKCDIKSTSLMGNILSYQQLYQQGHENDEALLVRDELVVEAPSSNLFIVKGKVVYTPPLNNILAGVTRDLVIKLIHEASLELEEITPTKEMLLDADEVWLTNSIEELKPIITIEGKSIGSGKPGPIWQQLFSAYQELKSQELKSQELKNQK
ncbi:MAG: aminotransferase class IV [Marinomonas sp.]